MTTPPSTGGIAVRPLTAWTLLALAGTIILFGFLDWIFPVGPRDFPDRFGVGAFTELAVLVAPVLALLIATKVGPVLAHAKLIGAVALIEYAVALLLGVLAFLITLAGRFEGLHEDGLYAFGGALQAVGGIIQTLLLLALLALAGLWTFRIYSGIGGTLPQLNVQAE
jgi:hypothetical protein